MVSSTARAMQLPQKGFSLSFRSLSLFLSSALFSALRRADETILLKEPLTAPIMFTAGADLGVDPGLTGTAIAWGDAWTNLIQPFWALPALAIAKLSAKDIMGYCLIDLLLTGVIICGGLVVWAL